jgi:hypothetical protein
MLSVVLDKNLIIAALRSRRGASFAILHRLGQGWMPLISVALILEYEAVGRREAQRLKIPVSTVDAIVRAFCFLGRETDIHFRLRPFLQDPGERIPSRISRGAMSKSIDVPEDLYNRAAELAARDHVSVEEFVSAVLANRLASREYIETRAKLFNRDEFEQALNEIPDVEPESHDRL